HLPVIADRARVPAVRRDPDRPGDRAPDAEESGAPGGPLMQSPRGLIFRRRASNVVSKLLGTVATLFGLSWLVWILIVTLLNGARALSPHIFTDITPPPGVEGGGLANALVGS